MDITTRVVGCVCYYLVQLQCIRRINVRVCIGPVLQKKREKKRRLDNAVAGTSKIQSFFETSTAGGDKKFPREINEIEMAMRLPLHPR